MCIRDRIKPVSEVKLDAVDLNVASVTSTEKIQGYQVANDTLTITFVAPIPPDKQVSVTITYSAEPKEGKMCIRDSWLPVGRQKRPE